MSAEKRRPPQKKRRVARFAAVQALYQIELNDAVPAVVIAEFDAHRLASLFESFAPDEAAPAVDREWFRLVVTGASEAQGRLDPIIEGCLATGWTLARCGYLLRACLRAGAFELADRPDVPKASVIDEYVELAHGFFEGEEAGFVNAVLDRLGRELRPATAPV